MEVDSLSTNYEHKYWLVTHPCTFGVSVRHILCPTKKFNDINILIICTILLYVLWFPPPLKLTATI
jgi:hypothetical protein